MVTIGGENAAEPPSHAGGRGRGPSRWFHGPREGGRTGRPRPPPAIPPGAFRTVAHFRFFTAVKDLSWAAKRFVEVDHHDCHSLVALSGQNEEVVGHGYYALDKPGVAEVALAVADSMQGMGLGTILLRHPPAPAAAPPITTLPSHP